ncbi:hypothetical protein ACFPK5_40550 [Streptomyces beijiangensis]|uniref:hypothetical protein n=1 Tax=Streptomyces beijiangensis TaxID=163361 RepID=UPI0036191F10
MPTAPPRERDTAGRPRSDAGVEDHARTALRGPAPGHRGRARDETKGALRWGQAAEDRRRGTRTPAVPPAGSAAQFPAAEPATAHLHCAGRRTRPCMRRAMSLPLSSQAVTEEEPRQNLSAEPLAHACRIQRTGRACAARVNCWTRPADRVEALLRVRPAKRGTTTSMFRRSTGGTPHGEMPARGAHEPPGGTARAGACAPRCSGRPGRSTWELQTWGGDFCQLWAVE